MDRRTVWRVTVDSLCLAAVGIPILLIKYSLSPTLRGFYCSDSSLYYPYHHSTVPTALNVAIRQDSSTQFEIEARLGGRAKS